MKIAILGCGVMGSSFARRFSGHELVLCDHNEEKTRALADEIKGTFVANIQEAIQGADVILLAIKPKDLDPIAIEMGELQGQIVFSILAGVDCKHLEHLFPDSTVVRGMPNLALIHGESVIALVESEKSAKDKMDDILQGMGLVIWVEEDKIDAITALAGSGPAFVIAMMEAMIETGIMMGLKAEESQKLVLQTIRGALSLVENYEGHPGGVRWKICAPKGTTIAGMHTFEEEGVRAGIMNTLLATFQKAKEML